MSTISVTEAQVSVVFPMLAEIYNVKSAAAVEAGEVLYQTTSGDFGLCDTGEAAKDEPALLALESVGSGDVLSALKRGAVYGFDVSTEDYGNEVYASNTAGEVSDSAVDEVIGKVMPLADNDLTKVVYFDFPTADVN